MAIHPLAGKPAPEEFLVDVDELRQEYYSLMPDVADRTQRVSFGTSGHRGSSFRGAFNEAHVLAITQAICTYRSGQGISGPLFIGKDTHALSDQAFATALEVLAANGVETMIDGDDGYTPTPAVSHAILRHNRNRTSGLADGIVITPSHNPPEDGGFKYNPPHGGPADADVTRWIEDEANQLLSSDLGKVARIPYERARQRRQYPRIRLRRIVRGRPGVGRRHGGHPKHQTQDRRRSARWSERGVLAANRRTLRDRPAGGE